MLTNKKENILFSLIMCFGMNLVMTIYNLLLNGVNGSITIQIVVGDFIIGFIISLMLNIFIVGPGVKKLVLPINKYKKLNMIKISTFMAIGMVFFMSFFGLAVTYLHGGINVNSLVLGYFSTFSKSFIAAYPLQLIVIEPLVRHLFNKFVLKNKNVGAV
ncbi:DUF2798 domain-containing protein [Paenibacillus larvae]|uniref:DUF2798 domain-containing protein n=1 Tax=Paenibacillus larvae TaxID=1464 RepID=UPI002282E6E7|nr:DUF2798 domain-containing protein [Paenibacillus larvae]MCY9512268.1 DUF2798 domain-containing protein [Paenibacillus larvae]MCY9527546.1 DUF2798 domain-containing protein [Paenibacillus larvae]